VFCILLWWSCPSSICFAILAMKKLFVVDTYV
jgi:hypothetical protein